MNRAHDEPVLSRSLGRSLDASDGAFRGVIASSSMFRTSARFSTERRCTLAAIIRQFKRGTRCDQGIEQVI